jgi:hypothetical protein
MTRDLVADLEKLLRDPAATICGACGKVAKPRTRGKAVLGAIVLVLLVPVLALSSALLFGRAVAHTSSWFFAIAFLASSYAAVRTLREAANRTCPKCGKSPMISLPSPEGQRFLLELSSQLAPTTVSPESDTEQPKRSPETVFEALRSLTRARARWSYLEESAPEYY